jgi:hypothetical protein
MAGLGRHRTYRECKAGGLPVITAGEAKLEEGGEPDSTGQAEQRNKK